MEKNEWRKSSYSNPNGNSIELRWKSEAKDVIELRESDKPNVVVETTPEKLEAFLDGVDNGEFDEFIPSLQVQ